MQMTHGSSRRKSGQSIQGERPTHHSDEDREMYPPCLHTTMKPVPPGMSRRKSEGDSPAVSEQTGKAEFNLRNPMCGDGAKSLNAPPELTKATTKPTGVPLAKEQLAGKIQAAAGNELIIHRLEEIEDRKDPERVRPNTQLTHCVVSVRSMLHFPWSVWLGVAEIITVPIQHFEASVMGTPNPHTDEQSFDHGHGFGVLGCWRWQNRTERCNITE